MTPVLSQAWQSIKQPRHIKVLYWFAYLATVFGGLATLFAPPQTVKSELGPWLTGSLAVLMILAGVVGLCTVLGGWWKVERLGLWCALGAAVIYASVVTTLHFTSEGSRLTQLTWITLGGAFFLVRMFMVWGQDYEPKGKE